MTKSHALKSCSRGVHLYIINLLHFYFVGWLMSSINIGYL